MSAPEQLGLFGGQDEPDQRCEVCNDWLPTLPALALLRPVVPPTVCDRCRMEEQLELAKGRHVRDRDVLMERLGELRCKVRWRQHSTDGKAQAAVLPPRDETAAKAAWGRAVRWFERERSGG